jgi:hypothetical protein
MIVPSINMNGNVLILNDDNWMLKSSEVALLKSDIVALNQSVLDKDRIINDLVTSKEACDNTINAMKFKHEILLDMLAVSNADEKTASVRYEKEKIKGGKRDGVVFGDLYQRYFMHLFYFYV